MEYHCSSTVAAPGGGNSWSYFVLSFFPVGKLQLQWLLLAHSVTVLSPHASDPQRVPRVIPWAFQHGLGTGSSRRTAGLKQCPEQSGCLWQGHYRGSLTPFLQHRHTVPRSSEGLLSVALSCGGGSLTHSFSQVLLLKAVPTSQCEASPQQSGHGGIPGKSAQQLKQRHCSGWNRAVYTSPLMTWYFQSCDLTPRPRGVNTTSCLSWASWKQVRCFWKQGGMFTPSTG